MIGLFYTIHSPIQSPAVALHSGLAHVAPFYFLITYAAGKRVGV